VLRAWVFAQALNGSTRRQSRLSLPSKLAAIPEDQRLAGIAELSPGVDAAGRHAAQVRQVCRWIADGDCYQINLTFPLTFRIYGHPLALYARLRERQPVRYGGYVGSARKRFFPSRRSCFSSARQPRA
jgi:para-aminobenzoate synthetase/4-amino-4-deoxychorismate lyase